jgi:anion-transporting  ArsA/GET3 family ATPase
MSVKPTRRTIDDLLNTRSILVTCGTGGVGKTTLSAAIALRAALLGKRAVVITIDPAKRLKTSLGLEKLGDDPLDLTPQIRAAYEKAKSAGIKVPEGFLSGTGTLAAIVPDTHKTFEAFVHELAGPKKDLAARVLKNPLFQIFSTEFSGANEYMAVERLFSLYLTKDFDCIILDTPPSRNTLAFLNAPKLLSAMFEERLVRWLVVPANRLVSVGMRKVLGLLESLTGSNFMTHLLDFAAAVFEVQGAFSENLKRIMRLLESKEVGFLMVTAPSSETVPEVRHFIRTLEQYRFRFDGVAVNRTLGYLNAKLPGTLGGDKSVSPEAQQKLSEAVKIVEALQAREERVFEALVALAKTDLENQLFARLPELARDVHSVEDLFHVALALGQ